jgi:signal peptidase I
MRQFLASLLEIAEIALVAIGAVFIIRSFLVQPFLVSGASMSPNFSDGDYLLIDELTYHFRVPERGEVVVFRYPKDTSTFFIKRIVGLPGERVVVKEGAVTIFNSGHSDGFALDEFYLPKNLSTSGNVDVTVSPGEYFVMGDNRPYSFDSRSWGELPAKDLIGVVRLRLWPPNELSLFAAPNY